MARQMKALTVIVSVAFLLSLLLYGVWKLIFLLSLCISLGTAAYHFLMRMAIGYIVNAIFHNHMNYKSQWFKEHRFEKKLYSFLKLKKLMNHGIPTYSPDAFSSKLHSFDEIAQATCQAEVVHEIIIIFSFVPLLFTFLFGAFWVFLITSLLSAFVDLFFVIVQRYKRPILLRFISRHKAQSKSD